MTNSLLHNLFGKMYLGPIIQTFALGVVKSALNSISSAIKKVNAKIYG